MTDAQELGPDVVAVIGHDDVASYREAAVVANGFDAVLLEHEFGIFGGPDGELILDLVDALDVPLVVALHTVLPRPSANQARIVRQLCDRAASVMVFTATARRMVLEQHLVRASKLRVVPHGAPAELYAPRSRGSGKGVARGRRSSRRLDVRLALVGQGDRGRRSRQWRGPRLGA